MSWLFNGTINQKKTPAFYADVLANRPAAGYDGRVFIAIDSPYGIYRDNGSTWVQIASSGVTTTATLQDVTTNGNTSNKGIAVSANGIGIGTTIPAANKIDIHSASGIQATLNGTTTTNAGLQLQNAGVGKWRLRNNYNAGANDFGIYDETNAIDRIAVTNAGVISLTGITNTSGNLNVGGATNNVWALNVNGAANFSGTLNGVASFWSGESAMGYNNAITFGGFPFRFKIARSSAGDLPVYFDDEYDNALSSINFRMRTTGSINTPLTIKFNNILTNVRLNVNGATDNAAYQLNVNGNGLLSGSLSATSGNFSGSGNFSTLITINGSGSGEYQSALLLKSATTSSPELRATGVYTFNEGTDATWFVGNAYNDATQYIIGRIAGTAFDAGAANISNKIFSTDASGNTVINGTFGINGVTNNVTNGDYTPTVVPITNLGAAGNTAFAGHWQQVGDIVTFSFSFNYLNATAASQINCALTIPTGGVFAGTDGWGAATWQNLIVNANGSCIVTARSGFTQIQLYWFQPALTTEGSITGVITYKKR